VSLYLELAETAACLPDADKPIEFLREGLERIPGSARLRIALALEHLHRDEVEDALAVLTHDSLRHNDDAALALLGMSDSIPDAAHALEFLGADLESRIALSPENRLGLAVLHARAGHSADAERLFATVPETPERMVPIAEARFHAGHFRDAARLMAAHLGSHPRDNADQWVFLGDIYQELGEPDEARKAYDFSLGLLTSDLPDKAAPRPTGAQ
jgi:tetratricopeptide (TPR) repeat protein